MIQDLAKLAIYHRRKERQRELSRRNPRELLKAIFSEKHDPVPPKDIPEKRPKWMLSSTGPGAGRGNSGLDELKVTSADQAFYAGVELAMGEMEKLALAMPWPVQYAGRALRGAKRLGTGALDITGKYISDPLTPAPWRGEPGGAWSRLGAAATLAGLGGAALKTKRALQGRGEARQEKRIPSPAEWMPR